MRRSDDAEIELFAGCSRPQAVGCHRQLTGGLARRCLRGCRRLRLVENARDTDVPSDPRYGARKLRTIVSIPFGASVCGDHDRAGPQTAAATHSAGHASWRSKPRAELHRPRKACRPGLSRLRAPGQHVARFNPTSRRMLAPNARRAIPEAPPCVPIGSGERERGP